MNIFRNLSILALTLLLFVVGCKEEVVVPDAPITLFRITSPVDAVGIVDDAANTITINVPFATDISNLSGTVTLVEGATISPDLGAGVDFSGGPVTFTVTVEESTVDYIAEVVEGANPLRIALVGDAPSVEELTNPEIQTAYQWALDEYSEKVAYFAFDDLTAEAIETAEVVWFHYAGENRELPAAALGEGLNVITDFYKGGGDLLLTKHASQYLINMGRIGAEWGPTDGGANTDYTDPAFNVNGDDWGLGYSLDNLYDDGANGDHPVFADLETKEVTFEGVTYDAIMLIDGGSKRDNGYFWFILNIQGVKDQFDQNGDGALGPYDSDGDGENDADDRDTNGDGIYNNDDDVNALKKYFEQETNSVVRASFEWDPVINGVEFFTAVEFNPSGEFQGRAFVIAPGAYEWYHNDGRANVWRGNVEGITANAFTYFGVE